jgi:hypothetical protein
VQFIFCFQCSCTPIGKGYLSLITNLLRITSYLFPVNANLEDENNGKETCEESSKEIVEKGHEEAVKKIYSLIISMLLLVFIVSCGSTSTTSKENVYSGSVSEFNTLEVEAEAKWNDEQNVYDVTATLTNKSDEMIQIILDCGELVSYTGKVTPDICDTAYSLGLEAGKSTKTTIKITEEFKKNDEEFRLHVEYEVADSGVSKMGFTLLER